MVSDIDLNCREIPKLLLKPRNVPKGCYQKSSSKTAKETGNLKIIVSLIYHVAY